MQREESIKAGPNSRSSGQAANSKLRNTSNNRDNAKDFTDKLLSLKNTLTNIRTNMYKRPHRHTEIHRNAQKKSQNAQKIHGRTSKPPMRSTAECGGAARTLRTRAGEGRGSWACLAWRKRATRSSTVLQFQGSQGAGRTLCPPRAWIARRGSPLIHQRDGGCYRPRACAVGPARSVVCATPGED